MSTSTLTDRYVHEVVRQIPQDQRDDVADELRTTIADTVDARGGTDRGAAEHQVLHEMGDPLRLAARYSNQRLSLIGPEIYPTYIRLLTALVGVALPIVLLALLVIDLLDGDGLGPALGSALLGLVLVGAQIIAWVTVVFAVTERVRHRRGKESPTSRWTPDDLPRLPDSSGPKRSATIWTGVSAVVHALLIGLIIWQHTTEPYNADGEQLPVLNPDLWTGWMWPILASLATIIVLQLARIALQSWTTRLVIWYAAAHAVFAGTLAWLLSQQMFVYEPFLTHFNGDGWTTPDEFWTFAALGVLLWSAVDVFDRLRELRR